MRISSINQPIQTRVMPHYANSKKQNISDCEKSSDKTYYAIIPQSFSGNIPKKNTIKLSVEIKKALDSKDHQAKKTYFSNLMANHTLTLRNCSDNEYIKTVQVLLDNIKPEKYEDKELFETQINLLSAMVRPNTDLDKHVNPDTFSANFRNFTCDDDGVVNKINRILRITKAKDSKIVLDINSHSKYPTNILSNFADTDFIFRGCKIKSMEGFLQSLKTSDPHEQRQICVLDGLKAKGMGKKLNKQRNYDFKHLYWQGKKINRQSDEYQDFLKSAYKERFEQDDDFRFALEYTKNYNLAHSLGEKDKTKTLLTEQEFIGILDDLRKDI